MVAADVTAVRSQMKMGVSASHARLVRPECVEHVYNAKEAKLPVTK